MTLLVVFESEVVPDKIRIVPFDQCIIAVEGDIGVGYTMRLSMGRSSEDELKREDMLMWDIMDLIEGLWNLHRDPSIRYLMDLSFFSIKDKL